MTGSLCAVQTTSPVKLPLLASGLKRSAFTNSTIADVLTAAPGDPQSFELLRRILVRLDQSVTDDMGTEALDSLLHDFPIEDVLRRADNPTRLIFERSDTLVPGLERHLRDVPLTILIGGASSGRSALANVLASQRGRYRYLAGNNVAERHTTLADEVEQQYATAGGLPRSELARLLTALILVVVDGVGTDVASRVFREADAARAADPARAIALYVVTTLRRRLATDGPSGMLGEFFGTLEALVATSDPDGITTVLLPFEKLESEWTKHPNPRLWTGLKSLAHDLANRPGNFDGRLRLLIMARTVPFNEIGSEGLSTWVLAMPPLGHDEIGTRLAEFQEGPQPVDSGVVDAVQRETCGIPVLTAALLHLLPRAESVTVDAVESAAKQLQGELRDILGGAPPPTDSGRLLWSFRTKVHFEPGDAKLLPRFAGGNVYLDDDLIEPAFQRLFRSGIIWFTPEQTSIWSGLKAGTEFRMAACPGVLRDAVAGFSQTQLHEMATP